MADEPVNKLYGNKIKLDFTKLGKDSEDDSSIKVEEEKEEIKPEIQEEVEEIKEEPVEEVVEEEPKEEEEPQVEEVV